MTAPRRNGAIGPTARLLAALAFLALLAAPSTASAERTTPTLVDRLYAILLTVHVAPTPDRPETDDELHARLHEIAEDAAWAAKGNKNDALLVLGVAEEESGFAVDVDKGPCRAGTCDGGRAYCSMQIWAKDAEAGAHLFADRRWCFTYGLAILHASESSCVGEGKENAFSAYASGSCTSERGHEGSKRLFTYWQRWKDRYAAVVAKEKATK